MPPRVKELVSCGKGGTQDDFRFDFGESRYKIETRERERETAVIY